MSLLMSLSSCRFATLSVNAASSSRRQRRKNANVSSPDKGSSGTKTSRNVAGFGKERKQEKWACVQHCGACCKLDKGPAFATPEEIFEDPADVQLFKSMVGADGWCIHYEHATRRCSIYDDRPYFCRVEEQVFQNLYGIDKWGFNKEACRSCRDTIQEIYGSDSSEMENFNLAMKSAATS